jgi:Crp-like helix-turn-helix domain
VAWWVWPRHGASGIVAAWRAAAACLGTVRDERLDRIVELGELVEGHPRGRHIGSMLPNSFITGDRHQVSRGPVAERQVALDHGEEFAVLEVRPRIIGPRKAHAGAAGAFARDFGRWGQGFSCKPTCCRKAFNEPEFSELFMSYLLTRNSRIEEDLIDQLFNSSEKRLARLLLLLANFGKEGRPEPIVGKFSQETLAEMIGTTRSRVSFFMNKFRKLGFIEYNGKLEVHNSLLNVVLHDKPEIKTRDEAIGAE